MTKNEAILLLSHHPKLGAQSIKKILAAGFPQNSSRLAEYLDEKIYRYLSESINNYDLGKLIANLAKLDIGYVTYLDKSYPKILLELPDCPAILFVKGDPAVLSGLSIAIVGSRKYSSYGARLAKQFAFGLASSGINIISGLALGIDAISHQAALEARGNTVAVLGCGLDSIYPVSNQSLAKRIIQLGGAVISEYPPGTEPYKSNFPARNRIIAGLSLGTLVVEAALGSGALITATAALEYNREVYAIPGPVDSDSSAGTNHLIKQGAKLTSSLDDIFEDYDIATMEGQNKARDYLPESDLESSILEFLGTDNRYSDEMVRELGYNVAEISYVLTMLEMKGILENVGGMWQRKR